MKIELTNEQYAAMINAMATTEDHYRTLMYDAVRHQRSLFGDVVFWAKQASFWCDRMISTAEKRHEIERAARAELD
jgi:hypothetical protein